MEIKYNKKSSPNEIYEIKIFEGNNNSQNKYFNTYTFTGNKTDLKQLKSILQLRVSQINYQDNYETHKLLGKGRTASVYEAKSKQNGITYAVKIFDKRFLSEKQILSIQNEVKALRIVRGHVNIITLNEIFEDYDRYYLVTELVKGQTLFEKLESQTLEEFQVKSILKKLIDIIAYMNSINIIHRDIQPQNIMVTENMDIKLIDFGISCVQSSLPYMFPKSGTPGYVPPELFFLKEDECLPINFDIFSLGSVFYNMISRQQIFQGDNLEQVINKNKNCNINFDSLLYANISQDAKNLLSKMLQKNPKNRIKPEIALQHKYLQLKYHKIQQKNIQSSSQLSILENNLNDQSIILESTTPNLQNKFCFYKCTNIVF